MKKLISIIWGLLFAVTLSAQDTHLTKEATSQWADHMVEALISNFWGASFTSSPDRYFFNKMSQQADMGTGDYWPQAHAMDVVTDAYLRTGNEKFKELYDLWWQGMPRFNFDARRGAERGDRWWNAYVDDMEWHCLALIRIYEATGEVCYLNKARQMYADWIWTQWSQESEEPWHGGITWKTDIAPSKNACSNGPAAVIAARLAQFANVDASYEKNKTVEIYQEEAEKIYHWERQHLWDNQSGAVFDNIDKEGKLARFSLSYNQGTFIGAAVELYRLTGVRSYIDDAVLTARYTIGPMSRQNNGVLPDATEGDGGLFHGIFYRYLTNLILLKGLDEDVRRELEDYLLHSATVMVSQGINPETHLYGGRWRQPYPKDMPSALTPQLTACMLVEALCRIWHEADQSGNVGLDRHNFFYAGERPEHKMFIVEGGKVTWEYDAPQGRGEISDAVLLSDGHILMAHQHGIREIIPNRKTRNGYEILWKMDMPQGFEIHSIQPIGKSKVLYVQCGNPFEAVVMEIPSKKEIRRFSLPFNDGGSHGQMRNMRLSRQGTMLLASFEYGAVIEFDSHGTELQRWECPGAWGVEELEDGNILVATNRNYVREFNRQGDVVWEWNWKERGPLSLVRSGDKLKESISGQKAHRLKNGNTIITNWLNSWAGEKSDPAMPAIQAVEVTPECEVVWKLSAWNEPANLGPSTTIQLLSEPLNRNAMYFGDLK